MGWLMAMSIGDAILTSYGTVLNARTVQCLRGYIGYFQAKQCA